MIKLAVANWVRPHRDLFKLKLSHILIDVMFPDGRECQLFLHEDRESWLHTVEHGEYVGWTPEGETK